MNGKDVEEDAMIRRIPAGRRPFSGIRPPAVDPGAILRLRADSSRRVFASPGSGPPARRA